MRVVAAGIAIFYAILLLALTFLPFGVQGQPGEIETSLRPFRTIGIAIRLGPDSHEYGVLIGNMLAFVPVGLLVPILARSRSILLVVGVGVLLSFAIEVGQFAISVLVGYTYRAADIDDIIVNTVGTLLGYSIFYVVDALVTWLGEAGR